MWDSNDLGATKRYVDELRTQLAEYSKTNTHGVKLEETTERAARRARERRPPGERRGGGDGGLVLHPPRLGFPRLLAVRPPRGLRHAHHRLHPVLLESRDPRAPRPHEPGPARAAHRHDAAAE